jgi:hypothetical protein
VEGSRALVSSPPAGLVVRTHRETSGDGPFRESVSVQVVVEPRERRQHWFVTTVRAVAFFGALGNLAAAAFASVHWFARALWIGQAMFLGLVFVGLRRDDRPLLVLHGRNVQLASGEWVALEDIRRVTVCEDETLGPRSGAYDLLIATPDRVYVALSEQTEADARFLVALVEDARAKL